jgi:uncharacterized Zn finger protein (UPF0148 family)
MANSAVTSSCCNAPVYRDRIDGGTYCTICDRAVDPKTGKEVEGR